MKSIFRFNFPALGSFFAALVILEVLVRTGLVPAFLIPSPFMVANSLVENRGDFLKAFLETLQATLAGLFLSILIGIGSAILFSMSAFLKKSVLPFAIFFQTVPIIAVAPLLVIYFGFGPPTVIAASFIVSLFPMVANTLLGLESADRGKLDLFQLYAATSWQTLTQLKLPSAYGSIYAGVKVSIGLAIIGTIAGEFVAGGGLGAMIDSARTQQRLDLVFGALILLSVMGIFCLAVLKALHVWLQKIRPYGLQLKD